MKGILAAFSVALFAQMTSAQNVGIGTASPHSKAILDVSSTNKGVLLPRMTTSERISNITAPPNGLLVYDTDKKGFYHHDGSSWEPILNGSYWIRPITSRKRIANNNDSIGIGTVSPTEWLDVDGNIRTRNNLIADNNVTAAGTLSAGSLVSSGNLVTVGNSLLNGDVTTNSDLIINNTTATLQLKSSSVNTGFFQLSGNDVRLGTNSGNSTGNLTIRMNGNNRLIVNPAGDMDIDGKITRSGVSGTNSLLPICYGYVDSDGSILSGTGNFTIVKDLPYAGRYKVVSPFFSSGCVMIVTPSRYGCFGSASSYTATEFWVDTFDVLGPILRDSRFYFVVYKPN